jgi:alginate O-acetyltransferase complex protein AlgI
MIFLGYDFVWFAAAFFCLYLLCPWPNIRLALVIIGGIVFQFYYGGLVSIALVAVLATMTYAAGHTGRREFILAAIALCATSLIFYKYTAFLIASVLAPIIPGVAPMLTAASQGLLPATIPLGISFFVFEFVHYLADLYHGSPPIRRLRDFLAFALFWPTMVAGPIKRYQQFIPALRTGLSRTEASDAMHGLIRIAIGFMKKWAADNLTGWIEFAEPQFATQTIGWRWLFVAALAFRILLDFSGYSDMAIGLARMMGIVIPENFNWPYLARSPMEFWQRWHMTLSLWIRDYIYIPLGGNRLGLPRRTVNALAAMAICGLWHGPAWNFVAWGIYHGLGLSFAALLQRALASKPSVLAAAPISVGADGTVSLSGNGAALELVAGAVRTVSAVLSWACTMVFVGIGWLLFFYPVDKALTMAIGLFVR